MILGPKTDPELLARLMDAATSYQMTPREKFEQKVSFVFGQMHDSGLSKDDIRRRLQEHGGYPADYAEPPGESAVARALVEVRDSFKKLDDMVSGIFEDDSDYEAVFELLDETRAALTKALATVGVV